MPDYIDTDTRETYRSAPSPPTGDCVQVTRAELDAANAIDARYRKWTGSAIVEMTQAEKDAADAAIAAAAAAEAKTAAKSLVQSMEDEQTVLLRNCLRLLRGSLVETRDKVNEVIAEQSLTAAPLSNRSWAEVQAAVAALIDAEMDAS